MAFFLSSMAYLEGSSPTEKLKKAYKPGMINNFLLWPWVQAVNFKYVPLEHRVLVVNCVALGKWILFRFWRRGGGNGYGMEDRDGIGGVG